MRKQIFPLICGAVLAAFISQPAFSQQKVDPFLKVFPATSSGMETGGLFKATAVSLPFYNVFIKTEDIDATKEAVESQGGRVKIATGKILTALVPEAAIEDLAGRKEVVFIEAAKPISIHNDIAMNEINANEVHQGVEVSSALTGANTIVGIVDTGVDYGHDDFRDASGKSRILYAWDQMASGGVGPSEINNTYGVECDAGDMSRGDCPMDDDSGHGTHITGIAAGRDETYGGVAPDASIIAVRYKAELEFDNGYAKTIFSTTICEGAYYIFKKAEKLGLPAVVNLSLGTHIGPHDGTSLFEECLDSLVDGSSGRVIVVAAGNETSADSFYTGLHAGYEVTGDMATNFWAKSFSAGRIFYLDIWGSSDSDLSFGLQIKEGSQGGSQVVDRSEMANPGESKSGSFVGGKISYEINASERESPLNGKPHVGITLVFSDSVSKPDQYNFDLLVSGRGHFDAWWYPDKPANTVNFTTMSGARGGRTFVAGDRAMSVAIPATAKNVIGVAAYTTRNKWDQGENCCQVSYAEGDLVGFSSVGPSANPAITGQKPEISAPGAMIASAMAGGIAADSMLVMSDGKHMLMAGTSMAAPFVAGAAALILSANPNYTYEDIERYITQDAYVDDKVGEAPNDSWGYGKLDVLGAVKAAIGGGASGSSIDGNQSLNQPEATGSASSCQLAAQSSQGAAIIFFMIGFTSVALLTRRFS